jgi:hypothetical protein
MQYPILFLLGIIKAVFYTGGWYWRILFLVLVLPVLYWDGFGHLITQTGYQLPDVNLYLLILTGIAASGFAIRIASLETPKVSITFKNGEPPYENISRYKSGQQKRSFSINVRNNSSKELDQCVIKIIGFKHTGGTGIGDAIPIPIRSDYQMRGDKSGRFHLSPGESTTVSIISYLEGDPPQPIYMNYYRESIYNEFSSEGNYQVELGVFGGGSPVSALFQFYVENDQLVFKQVS